MNLDELVIAELREVNGARFLVGAKAKGTYLDASGLESKAEPLVPEIAAPTRAALLTAGIEPYVLMTESDLRTGLKKAGVNQAVIDGKFAHAKVWATTYLEGGDYASSSA